MISYNIRHPNNLRGFYFESQQIRSSEYTSFQKLNLSNHLQQQEKMEDESFSIEALIFIVILVIYILASYYINKLQINFLHQSTVAIFLGFLTALFLKIIMEKQIAFSNQLFFSLLMPPIVFSVGYGMKKPEFFKNFLSISFLGIFSTLFSIFVQACIIASISGTLIADLSQKQILLLSIILSSSDPIATLPVSKSNTDRLNAILSGQSVLNCSVVIILFGAVVRISENTQNILEFEAVLDILGNFTYLFFCSILLGILFGFGLSYLFKKFISFSEYHIKQTSLILLTGYVVYLCGQFAGLSGIISLFTSAIVFSHYGFKNLSNESQHGTLLAFQSIRYIFQAFIFTYLGASLLTTQNKWNGLGAAILLISFNPMIRLVMIYILSLLLKLLKRSFPLNKAQTKLLWYTGIVRGIIAFALSLQIDSINKNYLLTATLLVVMCTTIIGATFFNSFCQIIGLGEVGLIKIGHNKDEYEQRQIQLVPSTKYGAIGSPDIKDTIQTKENDEKFSNFEQKYLKPLFTRETMETTTKKHSKQNEINQNV